MYPNSYHYNNSTTANNSGYNKMYYKKSIKTARQVCCTSFIFLILIFIPLFIFTIFSIPTLIQLVIGSQLQNDPTSQLLTSNDLIPKDSWSILSQFAYYDPRLPTLLQSQTLSQFIQQQRKVIKKLQKVEKKQQKVEEKIQNKIEKQQEQKNKKKNVVRAVQEVSCVIAKIDCSILGCVGKVRYDLNGERKTGDFTIDTTTSLSTNNDFKLGTTTTCTIDSTNPTHIITISGRSLSANGNSTNVTSNVKFVVNYISGASFWITIGLFIMEIITLFITITSCICCTCFTCVNYNKNNNNTKNGKNGENGDFNNEYSTFFKSKSLFSDSDPNSNYLEKEQLELINNTDTDVPYQTWNNNTTINRKQSIAQSVIYSNK
ncbi:hypothetical protein ABK040_006165 [Willaertia magna]